MFSRLSKRSKKTPAPSEEGGVERRTESGSKKVVEVPKGKAAAAAAAAATQEFQEQTTKVLHDVRIASPPVRLAVDDIGRAVARL